MGQLHLGVGTRYEQDGHAWVVVQVLRDGRLRVEDQSAGGHEVVTRAELTTAWAEGALRFAVRGRRTCTEDTGTSPRGMRQDSEYKQVMAHARLRLVTLARC